MWSTYIRLCPHCRPHPFPLQRSVGSIAGCVLVSMDGIATLNLEHSQPAAVPFLAQTHMPTASSASGQNNKKTVFSSRKNIFIKTKCICERAGSSPLPSSMLSHTPVVRPFAEAVSGEVLHVLKHSHTHTAPPFFPLGAGQHVRAGLVLSIMVAIKPAYTAVCAIIPLL